MPCTYFIADGQDYLPQPEAVGPWAPDMLHGRLLGGLAARELETLVPSEGWRVARLTVDLFRPAGFDPVTVTVVPQREGRRIHVLDATVMAAGTPVAAVRAVALREGEPPPGRIWAPESWQSPPPESLPRPEPRTEQEAALQEIWEFRIHQGGFGTDQRSRLWSRDTGCLVDEEHMSPLVRAAVSSDIASPVANGSDLGVGYINGDYTLAMARYPAGEWIGVETTTHLADGGIAVGACAMYDLSGPFGSSTATALANPILA